MYANVNVKTKKELKTRVAAGEQIGIHQVGPWGGNEKRDGIEYLEGPWYPQPHTWYAKVVVKDGVIVSVK